MNWYKKSQNRWLYPSDRDMSYYKGEDNYDDDQLSKWRQKDKEELLIDRGKKRFDKWRKIYINQDAIAGLEEQLKNPMLSDEQKKKIQLQIGKHRGAITHLHRR